MTSLEHLESLDGKLLRREEKRSLARKIYSDQFEKYVEAL